MDGAEDATALTGLAARTGPVTLAADRRVPVLPALEGLVPGGLPRGAVVGVTGSTSLALALGARPPATGTWVAAVGLPSLGLAAADELGVDLTRLVLVAEPGRAWATVVATLLDAFGVVLARPPAGVRAADARRLVARTRERGAVLVTVDGAGTRRGSGPVGAELVFEVVGARWEGLEAGAGHLRRRRLTVAVSGRRAGRPRTVALWLPDVGGGVALADDPPGSAPGTGPGPLRAVG